jgi:hypothetical protein
LRQVKANANLPNIVFVLLFQPSIVERALNAVADGEGRAFLEKIVQVNFDLPAVPVSVVHRDFLEQLSVVAGIHATEANGFSQTRWGNALVGSIQPMLRNMRDARRLISSIAVHMPLHTSDEVFEVNFVDFLLLESLRVFEPDFHEALFREQGLLLQEMRSNSNTSTGEQKAAVEKLLETVSIERQSVARDTLKLLFPALESVYGGAASGEGFHRNWRVAKRVCSARYFPRYFELQTAEGEISERRFVAFLDATMTKPDLDAAITQLEIDGLIPSLVARLDESIDRLPSQNAAVLLPALFDIAQKLAGTVAGPFNSPWVSAWRATHAYLAQVPEDKRGPLALDALRQTEALSAAAMLIHLDDPADQTNGEENASDPVLDLGTIQEMKTEWLRLIRKRVEEGDALIGDPDLVSLLYRWRDYSGSMDEPREWVAKMIRTDEGFARMAGRLVSWGASHGSGDRVSTPFSRFDKETIEKLIGLSKAKNRIDSISLSNFPEHAEALRTLLRSLEKWLGLRNSGPSDF